MSASGAFSMLESSQDWGMRMGGVHGGGGGFAFYSQGVDLVGVRIRVFRIVVCGCSIGAWFPFAFGRWAPCVCLGQNVPPIHPVFERQS